MALDYLDSPEVIIKRLEAAHDKTRSKIRGEFFESENDFFQKNVRDKCVLVVGSGLGNDAFELAAYNREVTGIEILARLVAIARAKLETLNLPNVSFQVADLFTFEPQRRYDTSILNMGTIGNFDDKSRVIASVLNYSDRMYCDFYLEDAASLEIRRKMYEEEGWKNVRIRGKKVISDDGLESTSIPKSDLSDIVRSLGLKVAHHNLGEFSTMAEIYR